MGTSSTTQDKAPRNFNTFVDNSLNKKIVIVLGNIAVNDYCADYEKMYDSIINSDNKPNFILQISNDGSTKIPESNYYHIKCDLPGITSDSYTPYFYSIYKLMNQENNREYIETLETRFDFQFISRDKKEIKIETTIPSRIITAERDQDLIYNYYSNFKYSIEKEILKACHIFLEILIILAEKGFEIVIQNEITFNTHLDINFIRETLSGSQSIRSIDKQTVFFNTSTNLWLELFPYLIKVILLIAGEYNIGGRHIIKYNNNWDTDDLGRYKCENRLKELKKVFNQFIN